MCFVWIWEHTAIISLYSVNWMVFITETECVYCAVRTSSSNTTQVTFSLDLSSTVTPMDVTKCIHWLFIGFPKTFLKVFPTRGKQSRELVIETARTWTVLNRRKWELCVTPCSFVNSFWISKDRNAFIFNGLGHSILVDVTTFLRKLGEDMLVGLRSVLTHMYTASTGHACSCPVDHRSSALDGVSFVIGLLSQQRKILGNREVRILWNWLYERTECAAV